MRVCYLLTVLLALWSGVAGAADSKQKSASCEDGIARCAPLKDKPDKYRRCMQLMCAPVKESQAAPQENKADVCNLGLWRCNPLRDSLEIYWACMQDTCAGEDATASVEKALQCPEGPKQCAPKLDSYRLCMNLICKNPVTSYQECDDGKDQCAPSLRNYWDCLAYVCLKGNELKKYSEPYAPGSSSAQPHGTGMEPARKETAKEGPPLLSTLPERRLHGPPTEELECDTPLGMTCASRNLMDCSCADGSIPRPISAKSPPVYKKTQRTLFGLEMP